MEADERAMEYACAQSFSKGESVGYSKGESVGFSKGESLGFTKGELEGFKRTAVNLKRLGIDAATISSATGLTLDEINLL